MSQTSTSRLFERLRPVILFIHHRYRVCILLSTLLTLGALYLVIGGYIIPGAPRLPVETDLSSLLPQSYKSIQMLNRMKQRVGGLDKIEVLLESEDFQASVRFAEDLVPRLLALNHPRSGDPYISSIDYRNEIEFFEKYQLLFVNVETLERLQETIDDRIRAEKMKLSPLFIDLSDNGEEEEEDALTLSDLEEKYEAHVPKEYLATEDGRILMLRCYAYGSSLNVSLARDMYTDVKALVESMRPASYHPTMAFHLGGEIRNRFEEYDLITRDALGNLASGLSLQILLLVLFFRQPISLSARTGPLQKLRGLLSGLLRQVVAALLIAIPLLMSIIWTFGITYLVIGQLNTITVFLFVILFGLGIDYGIHTYSRYLENRIAGKDILAALQTSISRTGAGIFTSALTTAGAFYSLQVMDFRGFSEFGFISGTGILCSMLAMLFILPAFLSLAEKLRVVDAVSVTLGRPDRHRTPPLKFHRGIFWGSVGTIVLVLFFLPRLSFEYNFRDLRARLPNLDAVKAKIHDVNIEAEGNDWSSPALILAENREDLSELVNRLREIKAEDRDSPTIGKVESILDRFPRRQEYKLDIIQEIRDQVNSNAADLIQGKDRERLDRLKKALEVDSPLTMEQVPLSVKRKFIDKEGRIGNFVFIYPSVLLRDGKKAIEFARDVHSLSSMDGIRTDSGNTYYAASGAIIMADMLLLIQREDRIAIGLTILIIGLCVFLEFRSVKRTILVLSPLIVGFALLFATQLIFNIKFNLYNIVILPLIIGYGIDGGVHMMHRYMEEGAGSGRFVIQTTGWAVFMTTVTTCAGFSGLLFVHHGGLNSLGQFALIGLAATLIATLFFLPSALQYQEQTSEKN